MLQVWNVYISTISSAYAPCILPLLLQTLVSIGLLKSEVVYLEWLKFTRIISELESTVNFKWDVDSCKCVGELNISLEIPSSCKVRSSLKITLDPLLCSLLTPPVVPLLKIGRAI
jgi:hypothetical protein